MNTHSRLPSASRCCALLIAVAVTSQPAQGADPPRPPARETGGFFTRLGNAFSRLTDRSQRGSAAAANNAAGASGKKKGQDEGRPVMQSGAATQTRYEQLPSNVTAPGTAGASAKPSSTSVSQIESPTVAAATKPSPPACTNDKTPAPTDPPTPPSATAPEPAKVFPTATILSYGRVRVPFPPYSILDVMGLPGGSLAKDPVSGQIFRVP